MSAELLLAAERCDQCLTTRNRIVSGRRAAEIVRQCRREGTHFICHKASRGMVVHCRGVHEIAGSSSYRFAMALGIPVREVDPSAIEGRRGDATDHAKERG